MEKVDGGIRPGLACWRIFWQAVDPEEIAGASLWEGPSRDSLQGQEAIHCIAVSHDQKRILEKLEPLLQAQLANFASGRIFLRDDECRSEPLLNAGIVSKDAIIVGATEDPGGPSGRAQSALDQVRAERRAAALDLEPPLAPEPESGPQSFVDLCLIPAFREMPESRHWTEMPDHKRVNDPLNAGDYPKAAAAAKELAKQYPDLDAVYVLWAEALIGMRDLAGARKIAQQGLERSRSKHDLCNVLGKISWNAGALDETVYWWTQGLQCQETLGESNNFGNDPNTYLYLAEIAHVLGLHDCASALILLRGDCIRSGQIRLGQSTSASIHLLVTSAPSLRDELAIIIEELVGLYVEPLVPRGHRADEVSELTRKLVIGLEQHLDTEEALQIIARLQAMGDLRAIPALRYIEQKSYSARISPAAGAAIGRIQRGSRT
jgi:tetratricopeptide (TPR) repeat protein